ncbi:EamA family transporter, partial [Actinomadura roseirufa]|uniref:EamA family transporter n=1 Tax=Actinomadura roseirufa TaxID=2094049 RepID=UPI0013F1545B
MSVRAFKQRTLKHDGPTRPAGGAPSRRAFQGGGLDILLAACLWGTTGTARTFASGASSLSAGAARIVIGGLVLLGFAALVRRDGAPRAAGLRRLLLSPRAESAEAAGARRWRAWSLIAVGAAAIAVYQTAFFVAVARTGVAVGTVVTIGSAPAFTGVIGVALRRSAPSARWLLATGGAVAG